MFGFQEKIYEWAYKKSRARNFVWKNPFRQWLEDKYTHFLDSLRPKCWHEGCKSHGEPCILRGYSDDEEEQIYWYCCEHSKRHGFCPSCGEFWGGVESFDFGPGYCSNCAPEFEDDYDEDLIDDWSYEEA